MAALGTSFNPSTGQFIVTRIAATTATEVAQRCAEAAEAAWEFAETSRDARAKLPRMLAGAVDANRGPLAAIADEETGLGIARLDGELTRTSYQMRFSPM